jgi:hypothetical protein
VRPMRWTDQKIRWAIRVDRVISLLELLLFVIWLTFKLLGWDARIPFALLAVFFLLGIIFGPIAIRAMEVKLGIASGEAFGLWGTWLRIAIGMVVMATILFLVVQSIPI